MTRGGLGQVPVASARETFHVTSLQALSLLREIDQSTQRQGGTIEDRWIHPVLSNGSAMCTEAKQMEGHGCPPVRPAVRDGAVNACDGSPSACDGGVSRLAEPCVEATSI